MAWMQAKLFIAKLLGTFNVLLVLGQNLDLENTLLHYGFFAKARVKSTVRAVTYDLSVMTTLYSTVVRWKVMHYRNRVLIFDRLVDKTIFRVLRCRWSPGKN
jgi:hypothetical protein